jgi:predicted nucleic acid-binding Zn ribbon protein
LAQDELLEPTFPDYHVRGQPDCPPTIGGMQQCGQLAGVFLRRHDQLSLECSRCGSQLIDILTRVGMVIDIDHFIQNLDPYSLDEGAK